MSELIPSRSAHATRIALRLAQRNARRHPGRSILIAALVAVPIIGMSAGVTVIASSQPTAQERVDFTLGRTQARIEMVSPPDATLKQNPTTEDWYEAGYDQNGDPTGYSPGDAVLAPQDFLPAGTRILSLSESTGTVRTRTGVGGITVLEGDAGNPALDGRFHLSSGRAPADDSEVALNAAAMHRIGVKLGDRVTVVLPRGASYTVVGTIEDFRRDGSQSVIYARDGAITGLTADHNPQSASFFLPDLRLDWPAVEKLNASGAIVESRQVLLDPPPPSEYTVGAQQSWTDSISSYWSLIAVLGAFALFEVCLLAGAAFLVGMRADIRSLATVASVGGDRRVLFRTVSTSGLVLGFAGGLVGVLLGIAAGFGYVATAMNGNREQHPGYHVSVLGVAIVLAVAVVSAWVASLAAARSAARIDVVAALRGSRRPTAIRARRYFVGGVVVIVGLAALVGGGVVDLLAFWPARHETLESLGLLGIVIGAVVVQLGIVLLAPLLLGGLSGILSRLGTGARIASRDAYRNHGRSVPTAAAITSTVFVAVFLMTLISSGQAENNATYVWNSPQGTISGSLVDSDPATGVQAFGSSHRADQVDQVLDGVFGPVDTHTLDAVLDPSNVGDSNAEWTTPVINPANQCTTTDDGQPVSAEDSHLPCTLPQYLQYFGDHDHLSVGSVDDLAVVLDAPVSDQARAVLSAGGAVSLYPEYVANGTVTLATWTSQQIRDGVNAAGPFDANAPVRTTALDAIVVAPRHPESFGVFILTDTADRLGLTYGPAVYVAKVPHPPTDAQYDSINAGLMAVSTNTWARYEGGPAQFGDALAWLFLGISAIITLAAAAVAIGLARSDAKRDDEVFDAIGSPPRLRRSIAFWQAIVIAGIGTLVGAVVGMLPVLAMTIPTLIAQAQHLPTQGMPVAIFAPPWLQLGLVVVFVPLAIAVGSWLTAGRGNRIAVRRVA